MGINKLNIQVLEELTNAFGPTGFEDEIQQIVKKYGEKYADDVIADKMGSIIFKKTGMDPNGPKIMLAGHSDEIGFIITGIEKSGFLKFSPLGGWWDQTLLSQEVLIRPFKGGEKIIGVIAAKPPHALQEEERTKVVKLENMYIDIGANSDKEVQKLGIRLGDPIVPYSFFRTMLRKKKAKEEDKESKDTKEVQIAVAKAFDDRIGVFIGLEVLRRLAEENISHPNTIYFASTTQEEVGLRGARTAAQLVQPDISFSLDVDISGDIPGMKDFNQKMGKGVCISAGDGSMIPNPRLRRFTVELAEEKKIKYQTSFLRRGGTDAGIIHITGIGVPSLFIGVSTRHIHSHHAILDLDDVENAIELLIQIIQTLDTKIVKSFSEI